MKKFFILFLIPLMASAFDLNAAYLSALNYNADYLGQIERTNADSEVAEQGYAGLLPQIVATGNYSQYYLNTMGANIYYSQALAGGSFQQVIFDFNKFSQYQRGKNIASMANLQLANMKQQLIVNVAKSYFDVLYATDNLNAIRLNKNAFEKQLNKAQKSFEVGVVTITDVNDAKANYDAAVAEEIQAQNDLLNKKNAFKNLTGLNPDLIQPLREQINLVPPMPSSLEKWTDMANMNNLGIKVAAMQLEVANQNIKISKSGHMPILTFAGNYLYQGPGSISQANDAGAKLASQLASIPGMPLSNYNNGFLGFQLNIPIFAGGGINSQVRQAISTYKVSLEQLTGVKRQVDQEIRNAYFQVQNGVYIVKAQKQALKSAKLKLNSDTIGYQVGIRNSIDLINSQKNYVQTLLTYNKVRYQYLTYQIQLEYLAGKINENFLNLINNNIQH